MHFENVVGIDFSHSFVDRCNELKECGQSPFCLPGEGDIMEKGMAEVSKEIVRFHICDWACKNLLSEHKKLLILSSLLYHNLMNIYTTTTKSSSLL